MLRRAFSLGSAMLAASAALAGAAQGAPPAPQILTGLDAGWPEVRGFTAEGRFAHQFAPWGEWNLGFAAYPTYQQGVRVAVGDVDGDGRAEIVTAPGKDAWTELKVFDGRTFAQLRTILPFKDGVWWSGAYVATGDMNGDGRDEIVDGLDSGCCTRLHVLDAASGTDLAGFAPYGDNNDVGVRVASGDLNGDGSADVIALPIGTTRISAFRTSGGAPFRTIESFGAEVTGPVAIAAADVTGDSRAEIVAAAPTIAGAAVKIFDPATGTPEVVLYPYGGESVSSLAVALADVDGDGSRDVVVSADTASGTSVKAIDTDGVQLAGFYVLDSSIVPRASLAAGDLDGDGKAEIVLGGGPTTAPWPPVANGPDQRVAVYERDGTEVGQFSAYPGIFQGGVRVALGDVRGDKRPEMISTPGPGGEPEVEIWSQEWINGLDRGTRLAHFLAFEAPFRGGVSVAAGDVDGDGRVEIVCGTGPGREAEVRVYDGHGGLEYSFAPFGIYRGGISVAAGDVDADGRAEIVVGTIEAAGKVRVFDDGVARAGPTLVPFAPERVAGVQVAVADVDGNGRGLIVVGETSGDDPRVSLVNPDSGTVLATDRQFPNAMKGVRLAAGDLDGDGRAEIVASSGFGGYALVHVFDRSLVEKRSFSAYDWAGAGVNLATAAPIGLPIAADARTVRLKTRKRAKVVVARFRDAGQGGRLTAWIAWGDGTSTAGTVLVRSAHVYDVRGTKRYTRPGRYSITVTLTDSAGRTSIARSRAVVSRR
jgi:FG-GAP-like repeat/FG-GAP repeat